MDTIINLGVVAYGHIRSLATPALAFLLLAIYIHRKNLRGVLVGMLPSGLKVSLIAYLVDLMLIAAPLGYLGALMAKTIADHGLSLIPSAAFAATPVAMVGFAAIFFGDMVGYFRHRLEHSRLLWSSHVMHHADREMSWLTLYRFHPINRLTTSVIDAGALLVMGFPAWAIVVNGLVRHNWGLFIHANVPWTFGPLGKIFVSPAMHRWHHVRGGAGMHCNFATVFCIFDRSFNTFYLPGPCNAPLGVEGFEDRAYLKQLFAPLAATHRALSSIVKNSVLADAPVDLARDDRHGLP